MAKEIERKFLVKSDNYKNLTSDIHGMDMKQGYFASGVRVRAIKNNGFGYEKGFITFKSPQEGLSRDEYEYEIPYKDAEEILQNLCKGPKIEKFRHIVFYENERWEVDEFKGDNEGLVIAELEMPYEDYKFNIPDWIDREVTQEKKYYNSDLTENPYKNWERMK